MESGSLKLAWQFGLNTCKGTGWFQHLLCQQFECHIHVEQSVGVEAGGCPFQLDQPAYAAYGIFDSPDPAPMAGAFASARAGGTGGTDHKNLQVVFLQVLHCTRRPSVSRLSMIHFTKIPGVPSSTSTHSTHATGAPRFKGSNSSPSRAAVPLRPAHHQVMPSRSISALIGVKGE